jgi:hypothetical protein
VLVARQNDVNTLLSVLKNVSNGSIFVLVARQLKFQIYAIANNLYRLPPGSSPFSTTRWPKMQLTASSNRAFANRDNKAYMGCSEGQCNREHQKKGIEPIVHTTFGISLEIISHVSYFLSLLLNS